MELANCLWGNGKEGEPLRKGLIIKNGEGRVFRKGESRSMRPMALRGKGKQRQDAPGFGNQEAPTGPRDSQVSGVMDRRHREPTAARCLCGQFFILIFSVEIERARHLFMVTEPGDLSPTFPALPPTSGCFPRFSKSLSS